MQHQQHQQQQTLAEYKAAIAVPLVDRYMRGDLRFEESDLIYSATERCSCGAGLAKVNSQDCTLRFWHCSWCLLRGIDPFDTFHDEPKEFYRWDIKSEGPAPAEGLVDALSPIYLTTRPDAKITVYSVSGVLSVPWMDFMDEQSAKDALFALAQAWGTVHLSVKVRTLNAK